MHLPVFQQFVWGVTFFAEAALLLILLFRGHWREYPAFTAFSAFHVISEPIGFLTFDLGPGTRAALYWTYVCLDFVFQLAIVQELVRIVLRPTGTWIQDAKRQFVLWGAGGALIAGGCAAMVNPPSVGFFGSLELRGNLFTSLLVLELFIAMTLAANGLGLGWRNHVMAIAQGLTFWLAVSSIVDALHSYFGELSDHPALNELRSLASAAVLIYWAVQFLLPEPKRQPISPALQAYIAELHERAILDLNRVS